MRANLIGRAWPSTAVSPPPARPVDAEVESTAAEGLAAAQRRDAKSLDVERQAVRRTVRSWVRHRPRACPVCGDFFTPRRSTARYCSGRCRTRAWRSRR